MDQAGLRDYLNEAVPRKVAPGLPTFNAPPGSVADQADRDEDAAMLQLNRAQAAAAANAADPDELTEHRRYTRLIERMEAITDHQAALASAMVALMEKMAVLVKANT